MKQHLPIKVLLTLFAFLTLVGLKNLQGQTTINFDDEAKWTVSPDGGITSYQSNHIYADGVFSATGGPALREVTSDQDGFPKADGAFSWRLRNEADVEWTITIASGGVNSFSMDIRRWDGSPSPAFNLEYSTNGGTDWTLAASINNETLNNSSDWTTFQSNINSGQENILIRLKSTGSTERIMVDNFSWTPFNSTVGNLSDLTIPGTAFSTGEEVTITWSATDVTTIKFQVRDDPGTEWFDLEGLESIDATLGTITFNIPTYATEGASVLRIVDTTNPAVFAESVSFTLTDIHFAGLFPGMGLFPANEAVAIPIDLFGIIEVEDEDPFVSMHQLLINFYEDVKAGTGNIRLYKTQGDELVATYGITGSGIQFWGSAIAIPVEQNLDPNTQYYVTIDAGAITDQATIPNAFDGNITWSFTTGASDAFETIPEIRGTEDEPALMGETVLTGGVVSHILGTNRFWIQDDNSGYNGILVYDLAATGNVNIGDMVTLVGTVGHYNGVAQLTNILDVQIISSGNTLEPTLITLPFDERWESMLVKVENVHYTDAAISYGEFEISDGTNTGLIDDWMYEHTPSAAEQFESITGILNYSYGAFKIAPRSASDIVSGTVGVNNPKTADLLIAPNPVSNLLYITAPEALTAVQIINTAGSVVKDIHVDTDLQVTLAVDDLPRGLYLVRLTTVSGQTLISKVIKQ